jgi:para-aminobenzoate synthetase/4-amino-4-deoxychorismate lyase
MSARTRPGPFVVLYDPSSGAWQRFAQPREIVATEKCGEVMDCLRRVERLVESRGLHAAGFVAYEAAPAFDRALIVREVAGFPLLWFGLFETAEENPPPAHVGWTTEPVASDLHGLGSPSYVADGLASLSHNRWQPSATAEEYAAAVAGLRERIAAGETYQVNYTFRLRQPARDPWDVFAELVEAQRAPYAAYIETDHFAICSASPELFFDLQGDRITARPMKGTAARGRWPEEDRARSAALAASEKDRAENAMIVDMMRNDIGRIARAGSVRAGDLFRLERYATLWQMTSRVSAVTRASVAEIFAAMFPCASVTGAPKPSTMRIIAQTETAPRRIYTGSVGLIAPGRRARFNVAIRTVLIDKDRQQAEYGVGGGVVWDSTPDGEYRECLLKAGILTARRPEFSLLESMLWTPDEGLWLLDEHLQRLRGSADYFDIPLDSGAVTAALDALESRLQAELRDQPAEAGTPAPRKVRLLIDRAGRITIEAAPLDEGYLREPVRLELAAHAVDSADVFLFHKTTHRQVYDAARAGCIEGDDVLLYNLQREVTETCRANIAVRIGGELCTPPVCCGLLAGTLRAKLLAEGKLQERIIPLEMLDACDELLSLNSVRGLQRALLVGPRRPTGAPAK